MNVNNESYLNPIISTKGAGMSILANITALQLVLNENKISITDTGGDSKKLQKQISQAYKNNK